MNPREFAFYYPGAIWRNPTWLKSLVLYFDGVAILVPSFLHHRVEAADPALVAGLQEHGLLTFLEPESVIDRAAAESLAEQLADLLAAGAFDNLVQVAGPMAARLSLSRLGASADPALADMLVEELQARGLAGRTTDGRSVSLHWVVRLVVLVLLAQILRSRGQALGLTLCPATDRPNVHRALAEFLDLPSLSTTGHVVTLDFDAAGVDLSAVPFDEILRFREEHGADFRAYARDVRALAFRLSLTPPEDRQAVLDERYDAIQEALQLLHRHARTTWRSPASLLLGMTGAAWTLRTGDPTAAIVGAAGAVLTGLPTPPATADAYSYLLDARAVGNARNG